MNDENNVTGFLIDGHAEPIEHTKEEETADDLDGLLAELGGDSDALITVSKINARGKREVVDRYHPSDFDLIQIRDQYGGGDYVLTGRRGNRIVKGFPKKISIAEGVKKPEQESNSAIDRLTSMVEANIRASQENMQRFMEMMLNQNRTDPATMRTQLLEEMRVMKEIMGGSQQQGLTVDKALDFMQQGMELGEKLSGKESGMFDVMKEAISSFGKPLGMAIEQQLKNAESQQVNPARTPGNNLQPEQQRPGPAVHQQPGPAVHQQPGNNKLKENPMFKQYIAYLVDQAASESEPGLWADLIYEKIPHGHLITILNESDAKTYMAEIDNRVLNYSEWFDSLDHELRVLLGLLPENDLDSGLSDDQNDDLNVSTETTTEETTESKQADIEDYGTTGEHPQR